MCIYTHLFIYLEIISATTKICSSPLKTETRFKANASNAGALKFMVHRFNLFNLFIS